MEIFEPITQTRTATTRPLKPYAPEVAMNSDHEEQRALEEIRKRLANKPRTQISFPVEVFPERLRNIVTVFRDCFQLPVDYHCSSILAAASVALGNGYGARYKRGQAYPCSLYIAIVGFPSSGKSPGLDFGLYPLYEMEDDLRQQHAERLANWREEAIAARIDNREEPPRPVGKDLIVSNATMEAINAAMVRNPKGLIMSQDELKAWVLNMNSYRAGSDLESWLSIWSGKATKINRTGRDTIWIMRPFVTAVGGIQPGVLSDLATNGKAENGFLARILFAYPDNMECPPESYAEPDESVYELYRGIIKFLNGLPNKLEVPSDENQPSKQTRIDVPLSAKAKERYVAFLNDYSARMNADDDEQAKGILGKLKQYCLRLALILEMLELACNCAPNAPAELGPDWETWREMSLEEMEAKEISLVAMERACVLTEYFRQTAYKVIHRLDSITSSLPFHQQELYRALPYEFTTAQMEKLADEMKAIDDTCKLADRTLERLRGNKQLFMKTGHGQYRKMV